MVALGAKRPVLLRIPFSHFCRKAEWGLTQAGIPYDTLDMYPPGARQLPRISGQSTVPMLLVRDGEDGGARLLDDSAKILTWAAEHAREGTAPLYPEALRDQVQEWEVWAGEAVGPVARREAYRVAYEQPMRLTGRWSVRLAARAARPVSLAVLKFYKARRFDEHDADAIPKIFANIAQELERQGTGYLLGDRPTAADLSVAALCQPFAYAAEARGYPELPGWEEVEEYVERVKPKRTTRRRRRFIRERHWRALEPYKV